MPSSEVLFAAALCVLGTWILTSGEALSFNVGDGLILLAALFRALMVTGTKRVTNSIELSSIALTQLQMLVVFVLTTILTCLTVDKIYVPVESDFWWRLIVIVIFCTICSLIL